MKKKLKKMPGGGKVKPSYNFDQSYFQNTPTQEDSLRYKANFDMAYNNFKAKRQVPIDSVGYSDVKYPPAVSMLTYPNPQNVYNQNRLISAYGDNELKQAIPAYKDALNQYNLNFPKKQLPQFPGQSVETNEYENGGQNIEEMKKGGIHIKESKKGTLHTALGVPQGEKIPASKLKIKESDSPALKKKKQFAINAKKFKYEYGGQLPIAEWGMYSQGFDPTISQYNPPQNLQPLNVQLPEYQINENKILTPKAPVQNDNLTQLKDFVPFDNSKPKTNIKSFQFTPITGNKYLNRGLMYANDAINHAMNIRQFDNGGSNLPMVGGDVMTPYYNFQEPTVDNLPQIGIDKISSINPISQPQLTTLPNTTTADKSNKFNPNTLAQGIGVATDSILSGINFGKGALDIIGSQLQNRQAQNQESKLYSQSVYSQAMDTRPQDYIYNRNALAENGKQIKEIGGKGMPNIEVEGGGLPNKKGEHIILNNGFSEGIRGATHEQGGIKQNYDVGTKITSDNLSLTAKELQKLKDSTEFEFLQFIKIPKKGKMTFAEMSRPYETKKEFNILDSKFSDDIARNSAQLMISKKNELGIQPHQLQESLKRSGFFGNKIQNEAINDLYMEYGGIKKAGDGLLTQKGYDAIDQYENTKGTAQGTSMNMGAGYSKSQEQKIKTFIENSIGLDTWNKMPENLKVQAYSWIFNHGIDSSVWKGLAQAVDFNKYAKGNIDMDEARRNIKESDAIATLKNANFSNDIYNNYVNQVLPAQYQSIADNYSGGFDKGQEIYKNTWKNRASDINSFLNQTPASTPIQQTSNNWMQDTFRTKEGKITPKGIDLNKNPLLNWEPYKNKWREEAIKAGQLKPNEDFKSVADLQEFAYNWALNNNPQLLKDMWKEFGITNKDEGKYSKYNVDNLSIQDLNELRGNFIDNIKGRRIFNPELPNTNYGQYPTNQPVTPQEKVVFKDRYIKSQPINNIDGLNIGIPLPNIYSREPLNYYKTNANYIDPKYLNVQDQLNQVSRGQRTIQNNLGSRSSSDISNLLQSQVNAYNQNQNIYNTKYNYDNQQDLAAQQFNAQAKTQNDQFNQQTWFSQLEDPLRRRSSNIGDQQLLDYYKGLENFDKSKAYEATKDYLDDTYSYYQKTPWQDAWGLPTKKSGGRVSIKPKLKKKK